MPEDETGTPPVEAPPADETTYLVYESEDEGATLKKIGEVKAGNSLQALSRYFEADGAPPWRNDRQYGAVSSRYFKLKVAVDRPGPILRDA